MRRAWIIVGLAFLAGCVRVAPEPLVPQGPRPYQPAQTGPQRTAEGLIDQPIDSGTKGRITRVAGDLAQCTAELDAARVNFVPTPDQDNTETCFLRDAGVLGPDMGTIARMTPAGSTTTCELALAVSIWRRQSVEPAAREILGSDVVQIDHFGTYACRPVNNQAGNRPSAHSRAAALDFGGVRLRDGRRITVAGDWSADDDEARFLKRIRDDACRIFGTVLSPEYNSFHRDHLHLEPGGRLCS